MKVLFFCLLIFSVFETSVGGTQVPVSEDTEACIDCHILIHPGIVSDWEKSVHARITPEAALKKNPLARLVSSKKIPEGLMGKVVGCAECHTLNPGTHKDTFEHDDFKVHVVVTPKDCATCHATEASQYGKNLMSHAYGNLMNNALYRDLVKTINGTQSFKDMKMTFTPPNPETNADSCLYCHGTVIKVEGTKTVETETGDMELLVLSGWPNQGVGRINPDGSKGSCAACHTRHRFSVSMARNPATCAECHKGPDVPAYPVYQVSKHGNIFSSTKKDWDFSAVPWRVGKDFTAPTCAACHVSLIVTDDGEVVAERTHQMNDRLPWRLFGLIYAHAHPRSPDTSVIRNRAGLPLPTELTGEPATKYLIDPKEQDRRLANFKKICLSCHAGGWVNGHFRRLKNTIKTTNTMTLTATRILLTAWEKGVARGPSQKASIFDETIEKMWVEQWLFYANTTRFASAMAGADYGAFANGRWYLSKNIQKMVDWLELKTRMKK
jgi:hydroxylamine dehydrogenase